MPINHANLGEVPLVPPKNRQNRGEEEFILPKFSPFLR